MQVRNSTNFGDFNGWVTKSDRQRLKTGSLKIVEKQVKKGKGEHREMVLLTFL